MHQKFLKLLPLPPQRLSKRKHSTRPTKTTHSRAFFSYQLFITYQPPNTWTDFQFQETKNWIYIRILNYYHCLHNDFSKENTQPPNYNNPSFPRFFFLMAIHNLSSPKHLHRFPIQETNQMNVHQNLNYYHCLHDDFPKEDTQPHQLQQHTHNHTFIFLLVGCS